MEEALLSSFILHFIFYHFMYIGLLPACVKESDPLEQEL